MPDLNSDALGIWEHLKPAIDKEIEQKTRGMVQRRKMKVTTAPSIATGKIGVTEAFGSEMSIPFATNLISATVGDMVWVEFMYGATNAFASMFASADEKDWDVAGDLTVHGVLDVTQRRAYNTLNTVGWRRVMTTTFNNQYGARGATGFIVRLDITSSFNNANNEVHSITLLAVYNKLAFVDESSSSNGLYIDKIRYTQQDNVGHIDIHYNTTSMNMVTCAFAIESAQNAKRATVSESLQSVADSPSGETVLETYTFAANTEADGTVVGASGFTPGEIEVKRSGRVVYVHFYVRNVSIAANTVTLIGTLSGVPFPNKSIRWLAGGGAQAYDAVTPVYAILETNGNIRVTSPSAISTVNITISYIV